MGVCNCSMFCCTLLYVHFSIAIILMGKRELNALLNLSSWCLVMVERLILTVPRGCLQFVIVVFPDHTHLLFLHPHFVSCLQLSATGESDVLIICIELFCCCHSHSDGLNIPFDELLLGPGCSLLCKKHALCDIPKQHWLGVLHHMTSACRQTCPV